MAKKQLDKTYYTSQKPRLLKDFDKFMGKYGRKVLSSKLGDDLGDIVLKEARKEFESLIPKLPYIGGKKNPCTMYLIQSAWALALYRALKNHGKTLEEAGKMVYDAVDLQIHSYPKFLLRLVGRWQMNKCTLRRQAAEAQKRTYPQDWVGSFVEGDGREFDFGIDFMECGVSKFLSTEGADEFAPYLCLTDFPVSEAMGTGLVRTMTIGEGAEKCDFRYKRGRPVRQGWPPQFLKPGRK